MSLTLRAIASLGFASTLIAGCDPLHDDLYEYQQTCFAYGFQYGSEGFSNCMLEQQKMDRKDNRYSSQHNYYNRGISTSSNAANYSSVAAHNTAVYNNVVHRDASYRHKDDSYKNSHHTNTMKHDSNRKQKRDARAEQIKADEALAHRLQAEEVARETQHQAQEARAQQIKDDEILARQLQAEENAKAARVGGTSQKSGMTFHEELNARLEKQRAKIEAAEAAQ